MHESSGSQLASLTACTNEELLHLFFDHTPSALAMFDRDMRYLFVSRRWRSDYGLGERRLQGCSHYEIFPEIPPQWRDLHRRGLAGEVLRAEEDRFERLDGSVKWERWEIRPWRNAAGEVGGIVIFTEDISERKQAEEQLRKTALFPEENPFPVLRVNAEGVLLYANRAAAELLTQWQCTVGKVVPGPVRVLLTSAMASGKNCELEVCCGDRDLSLALVPIVDAGYINLYGRDITERLQAEAQMRETLERLRLATEAAEQASRAKSDFLSTVSHEIRTPMTIFLSAIEQLLYIDKNPEHRLLLDLASKANQRLTDLIDDILDFSKIEAQQMDLDDDQFDLRTCLQDMLVLMSPKARKKNLGLELELSPTLPATVTGDQFRLEQVLINLIGNAIKFTDAGEVKVAVRYRGGTLKFSVIDSGIGIPVDQQENVFATFSQVDSSSTRRHEGTGLGLAISKGLVELMGGRIGVRSRPGQGSVFTFTLPMSSLTQHRDARMTGQTRLPATGSLRRTKKLQPPDSSSGGC